MLGCVWCMQEGAYKKESAGAKKAQTQTHYCSGLCFQLTWDWHSTHMILLWQIRNLQHVLLCNHNALKRLIQVCFCLSCWLGEHTYHDPIMYIDPREDNSIRTRKKRTYPLGWYCKSKTEDTSLLGPAALLDWIFTDRCWLTPQNHPPLNIRGARWDVLPSSS